ncbi:MAG: hypothetical protein O9346_16370 [Leptospiraceae bacterium]|nr:hypothetical protein [Leptospiraceae bacterium]MCZ8347989.1 hypothetical protein [Leptospiraceae bacterium]PJE02658.1 MAG: hypothetical protein CK427_07180 [Leptospira sp.]
MSKIIPGLGILSLFLFLLSCGSNHEFTKTAESFGIEESKNYGSTYSIQAFYIPYEQLPTIRKRLLNSLVLENPSNRKDLWDKIQNLPKGDYLGFYLFPETMVIPEYLSFGFEWNGTNIYPEFISYATQVKGKIVNEPGFVWMGSPFTFYPPDTRVYSSYPGQRYQSTLEFNWQHGYLFLFSIKNLKKDPDINKLRVISPFGGMADFSWKKLNND